MGSQLLFRVLSLHQKGENLWILEVQTQNPAYTLRLIREKIFMQISDRKTRIYLRFAFL